MPGVLYITLHQQAAASFGYGENVGIRADPQKHTLKMGKRKKKKTRLPTLSNSATKRSKRMLSDSGGGMSTSVPGRVHSTVSQRAKEGSKRGHGGMMKMEVPCHCLKI